MVDRVKLRDPVVLGQGLGTCQKAYLSERSFVRNGVVQIPKFDAKPNLTLTLDLILA